MKAGNWILVSTLALLGIALVLPAAAQNDSAVVQAAKQKASNKKSGHVYTDEDFPEHQTPPDASAATEGDDTGSAARTEENAADPSSNKADAKPGEKKADKSTDSAKAADDAKLKELEAKLADAKKGEQDLQRKLATLQQRADITQDEFRKNMYLDMISNQQVNLQEFRKTQESLTAQIEQEKNKSQDKSADQDKKADGQ